MKICIVEDEQRLAKALRTGLNNLGYNTEVFFDGESADNELELHHESYDLAIIDLMLPGKNGLEICKNLRSIKSTLPLLVLSARDSVSDKTNLLQSGADDYMTKPFSFEELAARIQALLRRPRASLSLEIKTGNLSLDISNHKAYYKSNEIFLSLKEFSLLEYFIRHPNQVVTREQLLSNLWDLDLSSNVIEAHIKNLRKKVEQYTNENILETIWGVGYRLKGL
jgi:DNA-binding response OmpR family regulator